MRILERLNDLERIHKNNQDKLIDKLNNDYKSEKSTNYQNQNKS